MFLEVKRYSGSYDPTDSTRNIYAYIRFSSAVHKIGFEGWVVYNPIIRGVIDEWNDLVTYNRYSNDDELYSSLFNFEGIFMIYSVDEATANLNTTIFRENKA